ncbi:MAG: hypothetical protein LBT66_00790, partial [Methanobrevibacter sp.]|nr:hypothetical protein [Candidatus Methanovirga meridionalis]
MKMNNKILIIILIVIIAVLAIGSFSFAKVESVSGGNCTINSYVGEYTELNYDAVANPGATVKEIVNSPNESVVDIYKYHVSLGSVVKDNNRLTKKDDLSLRPDQSYLIEGAHEGVIDIDYESLDNGTSLIKTAHNIKINVTKININYNIEIPDSKLNPNENTQSIPVNVTGDYYQVGMDTNPVINDLSIYFEFKYNDNGVIKTINSNSFSASSITKEKSSYNIKTPRLIGDTDYNVSVKPASGNSD